MRENYFPSAWGNGAEQFCALFPNRYNYIYKPLTGDSWLSADEKWQLSDSLILKSIACANTKHFIGARAGRASKFAVLDIDAGSKYHSLKEFNRIRSVLSQAGIQNLVPYRSSDSGGWHIYIFFNSAISCRDLNKQLTLLLQSHDFEVQRGQLEIFPNPGQSASLGFALRLPMQPGWAWLDHKSLDLDVEREDLAAQEALDLFLLDIAQHSNTEHDFHHLKRYVQDRLTNNPKPITRSNPETSPSVVSITRPQRPAAPESVALVIESFGTIPPRILADTWAKGRQFFQEGLSAAGQRAEAICSLSHYLFYGDPSNGIEALGYGYEEERQEILERLMAQKHNGKSKDINEERTDALRQIRRAATWRPAEKQDSRRGYIKEVPPSWPLENERRKRDARSRIEQSVLLLLKSGTKITASAIQRLAHCSWKTLYKHADLWRAEQTPTDSLAPASYDQIADDLFESSTHEYNDLIPYPSASGSEFPSVATADPDSSASPSPSPELRNSLVSSFAPQDICSPSLQSMDPSFKKRKSKSLPLYLLEFFNLFWFLPLFCFCFLYDPVLRPWSSNYLAKKKHRRRLLLLAEIRRATRP